MVKLYRDPGMSVKETFEAQTSFLPSCCCDQLWNNVCPPLMLFKSNAMERLTFFLNQPGTLKVLPPDSLKVKMRSKGFVSLRRSAFPVGIPSAVLSSLTISAR